MGVILFQYEGMTEELMKPIYPLIEACGFKLILCHHNDARVGASDDKLTAKAMLDMCVEKNVGPLLQGNTICVFTRVVGGHKSGEVAKGLAFGVDKKFKPECMVLSNFVSEELEYFQYPYQVRKDVVIYAKFGPTREIGWYNAFTNILWLSDITHYPEVSRVKMDEVLKSIRDYQFSGRIRRGDNVTIGADPEFEFTNERGDIVPARSLYEDPRRANEIGYDGHDATGELRPQPGKTPLHLARNIKRVVKKLATQPSLQRYRVQVGGGQFENLGGHIHVGGDTLMQPGLQTILYDNIAYFVLRGMTGPRKNCVALIDRRGHDAVRPQPHGWEWRQLPSFIINEEITEAVLCCFWAIVKAYESTELVPRNEQLPASEAESEAKALLRSLPLYKAYEKQIEKFIAYFIDGTYTMEGIDIKPEWHIKTQTRKFTVVVTSSLKFLTDYFTPVPVKLKSPVSIYFGQADNRLEVVSPWITEGSELATMWKEFGARHLVRCIPYSGPNACERNHTDMEIYLPSMWCEVDVKTGVLKALRDIVQDTAIMLSELKAASKED